MKSDNLALIAKHLGRIADCLEKLIGENYKGRFDLVPAFPPHTSKGKKRAIMFYQYGWSVGRIWEFEHPNKEWEKLASRQKTYYARLIEDSIAKFGTDYNNKGDENDDE